MECFFFVVKKEDDTVTNQGDGGYVTHGVQLLTYINELQKIKESRQERGVPADANLSIPPLPSLSPPNSLAVSKTPFLTFKDRPRRPSVGEANLLPDFMTKSQAHSCLKKSVAKLCAFHGYDQSQESALNVLTDATSNFLTKFCNHLRLARDKELLTNSKSGFPDVVCRVYQELNHGSILDIRNYYKNSIIAKHKQIGETAETIAFECHHLDDINLSTGENGSLLILNSGEDQDNIPEIHFPSSDEGDNGPSGPPTLSLDHNAPQIETGLQMLQSLEQYGSLDPNVMVTPPPPSAQSTGMGMDECEQPMSHDSNAALLLATVSPGSSVVTGSNNRKRRKTSDNRI